MELQKQLSGDGQLGLLRSVFTAIVLDSTGIVGFTVRAPFDVLLSREDAVAPSPRNEPVRAAAALLDAVAGDSRNDSAANAGAMAA
jgi:hypothetical protein